MEMERLENRKFWTKSNLYRSIRCHLLPPSCYDLEEGVLVAHDDDDRWNHHYNNNKILQKSKELPRTQSAVFNNNFDDDDAVDTSSRSFNPQYKRVNTFDLTEFHKNSVLWSTPQLSLREMLLDKVLNVENLSIGQFDYSLQPQDELYLPSLKTLSWHDSEETQQQQHDDYYYTDDAVAFGGSTLQLEPEFDNRRTVYKIMRGAPNLETIKNFNFDTDYEIVLEARKVHAVKRLCIFDSVNPDHLMEFVKARPQLKILHLVQKGLVHYLEPELKEKTCTAINELLKSSKDTLEVLDLSQFCSFMDLRLPVLEKLYQLTVGCIDPYKEHSPSRCFPRHFNFSQTFKNLAVLDVSRLHCDENSNFDIYFPSSPTTTTTSSGVNVFKSVKILVVPDNLTRFWMERLHGLCPNFAKLIIHSQGRDNSLDAMLLKVIRYWTHLESIQIRIDDLPPNFCLDSVFTGMREQSCQRLRFFGAEDQIEYNKMMESGQKIKIRPSISNLKNLKTLQIILGHRCLRKLAYQDDDNGVMPMSFVSARYGFENLPELKVVMFFDRKCPWGKVLEKKLESLWSHVNLRHKQDGSCRRGKKHSGIVRFNC